MDDWKSCRLPSVGCSFLTSLFDVGAVDRDEEEEPEDWGGYMLCICWRRAGGGGFELGGARLWSVAGPLKTLALPLPLPLPLVVVVCASASGMLGEVLLEGVESAWLDVVQDDDPGDGGDDKAVVGIHDDELRSRWS